MGARSGASVALAASSSLRRGLLEVSGGLSIRHDPPRDDICDKKRDEAGYDSDDDGNETNDGRIGIHRFSYPPAYAGDFLIGL